MHLCHLFCRWLQSLTMEVILSTAFGVKAETQTVENDPVTEMAKKATSPKPIVGLCKNLLFFNSINTLHLKPFFVRRLLIVFVVC